MAIGLGGSGHLSIAYSGITSANFYTLAATARHNSIANIGSLLTYNETASSTSYIYVSLRGDVASDPVELQTQGTNGNIVVRSATGYSADVFAETAATWRSAANCDVAINGTVTAGGLNQAFPGTQPQTLSIGAFRYQNVNYDRLNGAIANVAFWNVSLTDREITAKTKGFPARRISPRQLKVSVPGVRTVYEAVAGLTVTTVNTAATVARHPRCYGFP